MATLLTLAAVSPPWFPTLCLAPLFPKMGRLKSLPRLIILDTSGNPVCSSPHFRLLVLFKIPTLKVCIFVQARF